jgi:hypothetical protein
MNKFLMNTAGDGSGAGAGSTPPAASATPPTPTWTESLGDDLKGYVQTKGFKEPKDVVESYRNFEKLQGVPKERLLQLPESLETGDMAAIWERLGKPKEAKEYKIEVPKELGDEKFNEWAKETFHKLNMPRGMAEGFINALSERQKGALLEMTDNKLAKVKADETALKKDWGQAFEQNSNIANQAAAKFGISKEELTSLGNSLGPAKAMKFLHKLGEGIGEASFVTGNTAPSGHMTPEQAKTQIRELIRDSDFHRRLSAGDVDAKARWDRLHKYAAPGDVAI